MTALVLAALAASCGRDEGVVLSFIRGSDQSFAEAQAAAAEWRACGGDIEVTRDAGYVPLEAVDVVRDLDGRAHPDHPGATTRIEGRPLRVQFVENGDVATTLRHEFGHALRLEHAAGGVMRPGTPTHKLTDADCAFCRAHGGCD